MEPEPRRALDHILYAISRLGSRDAKGAWRPNDTLTKGEHAAAKRLQGLNEYNLAVVLKNLHHFKRGRVVAHHSDGEVYPIDQKSAVELGLEALNHLASAGGTAEEKREPAPKPDDWHAVRAGRSAGLPRLGKRRRRRAGVQRANGARRGAGEGKSRPDYQWAGRQTEQGPRGRRRRGERLSEKANELEAAHQWAAAEQALRTALKLLGAPDDVWNARAAAEDDAWEGNAWWRADADYKTVVAAASCHHNLGQLLADTVRPAEAVWHASAACAAYEAAMAAAPAAGWSGPSSRKTRGADARQLAQRRRQDAEAEDGGGHNEAALRRQGPHPVHAAEQRTIQQRAPTSAAELLDNKDSELSELEQPRRRRRRRPTRRRRRRRGAPRKDRKQLREPSRARLTPHEGAAGGAAGGAVAAGAGSSAGAAVGGKGAEREAREAREARGSEAKSVRRMEREAREARAEERKEERKGFSARGGGGGGGG